MILGLSSEVIVHRRIAWTASQGNKWYDTVIKPTVPVSETPCRTEKWMTVVTFGLGSISMVLVVVLLFLQIPPPSFKIVQPTDLPYSKNLMSGTGHKLELFCRLSWFCRIATGGQICTPHEAIPVKNFIRVGMEWNNCQSKLRHE